MSDNLPDDETKHNLDRILKSMRPSDEVKSLLSLVQDLQKEKNMSDELKMRIKELEENTRWTAQTVHQGYHTDHPGTFMECGKVVCDAARQMLERKVDEQS